MASQSRFLFDVREHQMTIELDQGVHRSILFKRPRSSSYHFRLVTWPGHLAISGDCESFTFGCKYVEAASREAGMPSLFDLLDADQPENQKLRRTA